MCQNSPINGRAALVQELSPAAFAERLKKEVPLAFDYNTKGGLSIFHRYLSDLSKQNNPGIVYDPIAFARDYTVCEGIADFSYFLNKEGYKASENQSADELADLAGRRLLHRAGVVFVCSNYPL
jgi:hypothetical protein